MFFALEKTEWKNDEVSYDDFDCDGDSYRVEYFYDSGEELEDVLDEDGFSKLEFESDGCLELEYF